MRMRSALLALAFSVAVAGGITGLTVSAETREAGVDETPCAGVAWPKIPAACLEGGRAGEVRYIDAPVTEPAAQLALQIRFDAAFRRGT